MGLKKLQKETRAKQNPKKAKLLQRFFKTGKGEYGHGDVFLGLMVPQSRLIVKRFSDLSLEDTEKLLHSRYHEERLIALLLLVRHFEKGTDEIKKKIFRIYLRNTAFINNWDLVDLSAPRVVGGYLFSRSRKPLYRLAASDDLWEKRIAIVATGYFIWKGDLSETFRIAELLRDDRHDLIHKAVGWMLREAGKKDVRALERFLQKYYRTMPRTMLRYAIEKFPEKRRKAYLKGRV